jgi:hypothetical protein
MDTQQCSDRGNLRGEKVPDLEVMCSTAIDMLNQEWNWSSDGRRNGSINSRNDLAPLSPSSAGHWFAGCNIILVPVY